MSATRSTHWFWNDWQGDPLLRLCSLAAQGLWMRLLCVAGEADPHGFVIVNGRAPTDTEIATIAGAEVELRRLQELGLAGDLTAGDLCTALLAELERNGVFSRDRLKRMYSRRMVRDAKRAAVSRENGKLGGNLSLSKQRRIPTQDNPPGARAGKNLSLSLKKEASQLPDSRSPPETVNGAHPDPALVLIATVDQAIIATLGENRARPYPHSTDLIIARAWLQAGVDPELLRSVVGAVAARWVSDPMRPPPDRLSYFRKPVAQALAERDREPDRESGLVRETLAQRTKRLGGEIP